MVDKRKGIPTPGSPNFWDRMREFATQALGQAGDRMERFVTLRDLADSGVIELDAGWKSGQNVPPVAGPGGGGIGTGVPPTPTGFEVAASISNVFIKHDAPRYSQGGGHARTIVYGARYTSGDPPVFADAQQLMEFTGTVDSYPTNPSITWHLWIRWQARSGALSPPAGGTNGLTARTGQDVSQLIEALTDAAEDPDAPYSRYSLRADMIYAVDATTGTNTGLFTIVTAPITNNGVVVPVGVYMKDAFIQNGVITNAKIGNLAVDDAKIANLNVSKLTAGSLLVGSYIQSANYVSGSMGFRINGAGNAEFNEVIIRGTVFASAGVFTGTVNADAGYFRGDLTGASGTFAGGVRGGGFTGYAWPPSGQVGFYLGPQGLLLGNANDGRYFQVEANGNLYMPGLQVVNGQATFTGKLNITGASGNRLEMDENQIRVYTGGVLRVLLGVGF